MAFRLFERRQHPGLLISRLNSPAHTPPYQRFACALANDDAGHGATVDRYSFDVGHSFPPSMPVYPGALKDRMDITGARWGLDGAEAILKLRAIRANGDFDDYWRFHLDQEHQRVHQARYAAKTIPPPT
jgi:hypothetical protein